MTERVNFTINGKAVAVPAGTTVAVAMALAGAACRVSVTGEPRGAFCGMGICFECRVRIEGRAQQRACQVMCAAGMKVETNG